MVNTALYFLEALILLSSVLVILKKNPVHSVLFLMFAFFCSSGIMVIFGAEYVAMILIIVYVGAVVILFLFVVMMLDIDVKELNKQNKLSIVSVILSLIFIAIIAYAASKSAIFAEFKVNCCNEMPVNVVKSIGKVLYTDYILEFQLIGLTLFLVMIGVISLVHEESKKTLKRQNITSQILRKKSDSVKLVDVKFGEGVKI
ncbi:MAG: NADH-quinone oxidoreductase subunit J [Candidatus Midichloriaceae bacterium]|jgi:NADH-quinone oxidoreductase subunit J